MSKKLLTNISSIFREEISKKNTWSSGELIILINDVVNRVYLESKKKESDLIYPRMMEAYHNFYLNKVGVKPKIGPIEGKSIKSITKYLKEVVKDKDAGDDGVVSAWEFVLNNWKKWDKFNQKQLKLNQIESNITNILNEIKNGTNSPKLAGTYEEQVSATLEALRELRRNGGSNTNTGEYLSQ